MVQYTDTVSESITLTRTVKSGIPLSFSDGVALSAVTPNVGFGLSISNGATFTDTAAQIVKPGAIIDEVIRFQETFVQKFTYPLTYVEQTQIRDALALTYPKVLTDAVTAGDLVKATQAMIVLERLRLADPLISKATYYATFAEALRLEDTFRNFFGGDVSDSISVTDSTIRKFYPVRSVSDQVTLADVLGQTLILRVTAADGINIDDINILKMLFRPTLLDGVDISAAYISPNGSMTTWAVNTETGAVTEYSNYTFNSFAQMGYKYLGATSTGLYELNGDDDAGTDIVSVIKSGLAQFGGSRFSMFKAAYLGVRGGGDYVFRLETGDGKFYDYDVIAQDMQTTKIRLGKGLRARYFSFQLTSTGQDFDLDSIEFVPLVAQRRV